jgi:hypothetical protein
MSSNFSSFVLGVLSLAETAGTDSSKCASTGDDVKVSVNVRNTSRLDGDEVVQCYLNRDVQAIDPRTLPMPRR